MTDNDAVSAAFAHMRQEAKKRTGTVPNLNRPLPKASKSLADNDATPAAPRQRGIATGPDGRRRRRSYSVQRAGSILSDEIKKRGWRKEIAGGWVNSHWEDLVGAQIAAHTKVEMFKDKALFITCDSTAWATNLRMMQRIILRSISEQIGPDIIVELKIFGPKAPSWRHGPLHVKGRGPRDTYG